MLSPFRQIIVIALPPHCGGCGAMVDSDHRFCPSGWTALDFLTRTGCAHCNVPLSAVAGSVCAPCLASPPRDHSERAAFAYGASARDVALRLKYGRGTGLAPIMAQQVNAARVQVAVPLFAGA